MKLKYMLCFSGVKPPAPPGATVAPPGTNTIPQGSTVSPSGSPPTSATVPPLGSPPTSAGGEGGGGAEGERLFCLSLLNV